MTTETKETILPIDRQTVKMLSQKGAEPDWMSAMRLKGLELAETLELPKLEKTRLDRWKLDAYGRNKVNEGSEECSGLEKLPEEARALLGEGCPDNVLVQHNTRIAYAGLSEELAKRGVIFTDLETAVAKHSDLVQKYFMTAVSQDENRLTALHSALWNGGVFLYVPKNVAIEAPLQALFVSDDRGAGMAPHILIVAEEGSSVTYVDTFESVAAEGSLVLSAVAEVFAGPGAKVQFASVHHLDTNITDVSYRRAVLDRDARIDWIIGEMSDGNGISDTTTLLKGKGSSSDIKVICVGSGEQKLNLTTRNIHFGKMTESDMLTRAVMRESSTAIINGITKIEKGATGANGQQTEKVMMLSPTARGDANPILLIDEDDVKAGHAASVGQVSPEQIYYLMSRGISKEEAERLIIYGFLAPIVAEIPIPSVEEKFRQLVERKLGQ